MSRFVLKSRENETSTEIDVSYWPEALSMLPGAMVRAAVVQFPFELEYGSNKVYGDKGDVIVISHDGVPFVMDFDAFRKTFESHSILYLSGMATCQTQ